MKKQEGEKIHNDFSTDEEIRRLVIARLKTTSPDTIKCIGSEGSFTRDQLIEHVRAGDEIGETIERVEIEWLRALKSGIINEILTA
ncbi:MAG: hypothetical protein A3H59_00655 [Candidatus Jacksonbacteria bacterium RIFCSPLOWO2_02_FULL_43_9]|nr:MAG: hypothetical protein UV70_C0004G0015 [Parcubacteria group bacterium GW2011_GWA2_43_13]OGY68640.1 MAG: hypothetical protein A3B94_00555 [Candidatus Jacksonbacteria bacterium RIFCSPHIGHO2_02_FULL_43_10]OGY70129.1 MAG: hypothetical protein A2986_03400 [Candidatus Jacksonbacteria bacterium RIFCSPLOWO2_01_FULL_44_13]OGY73908.1 MAG: hypothetical protein A3H59_00655 [Candidatus Jacksonbacteria bacterium RIFCSPLOWO2_02_FULL_43_9]HAZ16432.1 hypothetical protein [Candidatus Jacksonbacteria bacter